VSAETDAAASDAATGGGCSFAPTTPVATPSGEKPIASLKVGDQVIAYNPTTGQAEAEPVQHVWINHDHVLVDVRVSATAPEQIERLAHELNVSR
jgi:hypothetical protein